MIHSPPGPLWCAVAWREGNGGVIDRDLTGASRNGNPSYPVVHVAPSHMWFSQHLAVNGYTAIHIDQLQATVEHHQILWFQVLRRHGTHDFFGVQPGPA